jgi:hypothetical protein
MGIVNRLALRENAIMRAKNGKRLTFEQKEHQVRFFGGMLSIIIGDFRSSNDVLDAASVEPGNFFAAEESILHNPMKLPGNVILFCSGEQESGGWGLAE